METQNTKVAYTVIDLVYAVALEPERYEELVKAWNSLALSETQTEALVSDVLKNHFARGTSLLQAVPPPIKSGSNNLATDDSTHAIYVCDANYKIIDMNSPARKSHAAGLPTNINEIGLSENDNAHLKRHIDKLFHHPSDRAPSGLILQIYDRTAHMPFLIKLTQRVYESHKKAVALEITDVNFPEKTRTLFEKIYGLTRSECRVLDYLVCGNSLIDIARLRNTQLKTVRTQLKSIFDKTSTHSQTELVRLAVSASQIVRNAESNTDDRNAMVNYQNIISEFDIDLSPSNPRFPQLDSNIVDLGTGDCIEVFTTPTPSQTHILAFHDEIICWGFLIPLLRVGLGRETKIHGLMRPGFGQSVRKTSVRSTNEDYFVDWTLRYIETQQFDKPLTLLCQGNGLLHAAEFANAYPAYCESIVAISPSLPHRNDEDFNGMQAYRRFISSAGKKQNSVLEFAINAGFRLLQMMGPIAFLATLLKDSPADSELINKESVFNDIMFGGKHVIVNGPSGILQDEICVARDWTDTLRQCQVPIDIFIGEQDDVSRYMRAERQAAGNSNITVHKVANAGSLLCFSDPDIIIKQLLNALE